MLARIRRLLAPPVFDGDEEKTRVAGLINIIAITALAIDAPVLVILPIVLPGQSQPLFIVGTAIVFLVCMLVVIRKGWVRFAGGFLSGGLWLITTFSVVTSGGVRAPAFGTYAISMLTAGLLLGWQAILLCFRPDDFDRPSHAACRKEWYFTSSHLSDNN